MSDFDLYAYECVYLNDISDEEDVATEGAIAATFWKAIYWIKGLWLKLKQACRNLWVKWKRRKDKKGYYIPTKLNNLANDALEELYEMFGRVIGGEDDSLDIDVEREVPDIKEILSASASSYESDSYDYDNILGNALSFVVNNLSILERRLHELERDAKVLKAKGDSVTSDGQSIQGLEHDQKTIALEIKLLNYMLKIVSKLMSFSKAPKGGTKPIQNENGENVDIDVEPLSSRMAY